MLLLAASSLALVLGATIVLFGAINRERVTDTVWPFQLALTIGILGGTAAATEPSPLTVGLGAATWSLGALLLYLLAIRKTPDGALTLKPGDPMPAFAALDAEGHDFDLKQRMGRRVLVKFFRGAW